MSKISKEELVEACLTELTAYFRRGESINQSVLAEAFQFDETNIDDLDRLLDIHFTLSHRVNGYLAQLPQKIRRISTTNTAEVQRSRGDLQGVIDWGRTTEARTATGLKDRTLYVTRTQETSYSMKQNLVLKALLNHLYTVVNREISSLEASRRDQVWSDGDIQSYTRLLERNVHLNRIPTVSLTDVTPRMLDTARQARKYLYYEAAALIDLRRKLQDRAVDEAEFRDVLRQTLAAPDVETLFELFCTFRMIRRLRAEYPELSLRHIRGRDEPLARLRGEEIEIDVYHDNRGSLTLTEPIHSDRVTPRNEFVRHQVRARETHAELMGQDTPRALFSGRPDLVVEVYRKEGDSKDLETVLLGEAKHTAARSTLSNGVLELTEYMMHVRHSDRYVIDDAGVDIFGFVFSDSSYGLETHPLVTHVTVDQLNGWS